MRETSVRACLQRYRLRRTLFGARSAGITTALIGTAAAIALVATKRASGGLPFGLALTIAAVNLGLIACWIWWVTPGWVLRSAEEYAERLLGISEEL